MSIPQCPLSMSTAANLSVISSPEVSTFAFHTVDYWPIHYPKYNTNSNHYPNPNLQEFNRLIAGAESTYFPNIMKIQP